MSNSPPLQVWTVRLDGIDEARANAWRALLDAEENERADRYAFASDRIQFLVAHALTRRALSLLCPGVDARAWRFTEGAHRKPDAWAEGRRAPVSFNLSHTNGMVGVAAMPLGGVPVGFDLEALDRRVTLAVAGRYFRAEEVAWLERLPEAQRARGFLRLWTLKEAFIKATGEGLARDLASFWFAMGPPRIRFAATNTEAEADWHFQQRVIGRRFVAAVGLHAPGGAPEMRWMEVNQQTLDPATPSGPA